MQTLTKHNEGVTLVSWASFKRIENKNIISDAGIVL